MNRKVIAGLTVLMLLPATLIACVGLPDDNDVSQTQDSTADSQAETTLGISQGGGVMPEIPQRPTDATQSTEGEPSAPDVPTQPSETAPVPPEDTVPPTSGTITPEVPPAATQPVVPEVTTPPVTTQPPVPEDTTAPEETTVPDETEPPTEPTAPEETVPPAGSDAELAAAYEQFLAMSSAERQAFQESFPSIMDFLDWYGKAREAYEAEQAKKPTYDGSVDIGDLIGGSN